MNTEWLLQELNDSPYVYFCYVCESVVLPLGDGKTGFHIKRNRKTNALEVFSESKTFSFVWDEELRKWANA